ncbi:SDR family NAD(P)-dependent oxidoreductase [Actinokineospora sp. 24-640]
MATEQQLRDYLKRATVELAETRQRLARAEQRRGEPIAIVGMACRYPGGADTVEAYWDLLREGRSGVGDVPVSRWDMDEYFNPDRRARGGVYTRRGAMLPDVAGWDAEFFGHSPREALRLDPQQRLLAELVWEALEDAGTPAPTLAGSRTGVLVGFLDFLQYGRLELERIPNVAAEPHFGQGVSASVVAGRIAYQFDLRGPAITVDTACSSSLIAVHLAVEALRRDECDLAIAAGTSLVLHPDLYIQACATSMLSADGACKTFDAKADGYVMGEGGGVVVLERLSTALAKGHPIRAVVRGSATNQDGRSNGLTAPSRAAQADVIRRALATAGVTPDEVDYVEAHGSGTRLGDAIELSALHDVFGGRDPGNPLRVGAVKTNIGHTLAAAGIAGLIKAALSLERGQIPPNLNYAKPARSVPDDGTVAPVGADPRHTGHAPRLAGVSAFGWSGSNAHVVLEAAPERPVAARAPRTGVRVLTCSAAGQAALTAHAERLAGHLAAHPGTALTDVVHTLREHRASHDFRHAVLAGDTAEARRGLAAAAAVPGVRRSTRRPRVAFLLPGTGDQYRGLGRALYRDEPVFAAAVDACAAVLAPMGVDVKSLVDSEPGPGGDLAAMLGRTDPAADPLDHAETAHPFLFTVEYALAELLASWGVRPDVLIGYSLGEYVAACLAGVFTLPDALRVVAERARLIAAAPAGRMVAVAAGEERVRAALPDDGEVGVAAINGPAMTVISGPADPVDAVAATLVAAGVAAKPLRSVHAFHSTLLEPARDKLAALVESVPRHAPRVDIVSNRTGEVLSAEDAVSARYWAEHLVRPVRFADGVATAVTAGVDAFIELGAGQTLGGLVRQVAVDGPAAAVLGTLPGRWSGDADERVDLLRVCARLWEIGVDVDWAAADPGPGSLVSLPTYPFQRQEFWPEVVADSPAPATVPADLAFVPSWRRDTATGPTRPDRLDGTLVVFADAGGIGARLADAAAAAGAEVIEVRPGAGPRRDGRVLVVDPTRPADYREVAAACAGSGPVRVVHLWTLDTPAAVPGFPADDELRAAVRDGHDTLLLAVQALGELAGQRPVRLLTATRGAAEVLGGDATAPHRSVVHGLGRAVHHEYPGMEWTGVDLDPDTADPSTADPDIAAAHLFVELTTAARPEGLLAGSAAWRRGRRWVKDWAPVPTPDGEPPWRADGTYLITGGTRGLGRALARHLVGLGVRNLALVGRTPGADVADLEAEGARVLLLTADAGVPEQLRAALRACRAHFGALTGVVHAAGLPAGGLAQRRSVADSAAVLAPKVLAMGPLAELVGPGVPEAERPELLVLYSSVVTAFGGIGEGDYCAANTVLDACGEALAAHAPSTRVVSVAWGPWRHDTWQADALEGAGAGLARGVRDYRARWGFADDAGCAFLDRIAATGGGSVLAVRQPLPELLREWAALTDITTLAGAATPAEHRQRFPRPALRTEFAAPRTATETAVAEVWGAYLGIDRVGVDDPFFDLGGNSLLGMAMVLAIERQLGVAIPPAVLFEHPTVAAFAAAVDGGPGEPAAGGGMALTAGSARGARRRKARNSAGSGGRA